MTSRDQNGDSLSPGVVQTDTKRYKNVNQRELKVNAETDTSFHLDHAHRTVFRNYGCSHA